MRYLVALIIIVYFISCSGINSELIKEINKKYPHGTIFIAKKSWGTKNNVLTYKNTWKYRSIYDEPTAFNYGDPMIVVETNTKGMVIKDLAGNRYFIQNTNIKTVSDFDSILSLFVIPKFLKAEEGAKKGYPRIYYIYSAISRMPY